MSRELLIGMNGNQVNIPIANKENFVDKEVVDAWVNHNFEATTDYDGNGKPYTRCVATLPNGFCIMEATTCVDEKNYSEEIGAEICKDRMENKVWELLGFLLATAQMEGK